MAHLILPEQSSAKENNNKIRDTRFSLPGSLAALPTQEAKVEGSALQEVVLADCKVLSHTVPGWISLR
jgi:hypothetical protein